MMHIGGASNILGKTCQKIFIYFRNSFAAPTLLGVKAPEVQKAKDFLHLCQKKKKKKKAKDSGQLVNVQLAYPASPFPCRIQVAVQALLISSTMAQGDARKCVTCAM